MVTRDLFLVVPPTITNGTPDVVLDFMDPFRFNIIKTRCRNHRKANEEDVGLGVTERTKSQTKTLRSKGFTNIRNL